MLEKIFPNISYKWRASISLFAGLFINFCMSLFFLWSTINIYVVSYFRLLGNTDLHNAAGVIFLPVYELTISTTSLFSMQVVDKLGIRKALFISGTVVALCTLASSFMKDIYTFMLFFAFLEGAFVGILNMIPVYSSNCFFPRNRGLVNGVLQTGFGIGGVIYNLISLKVINPDNVVPYTDKESDDKYFDKEVADRTPTLMQYIALYQFILIVVATFLIFPPPTSEATGKKADVTAISEIQISEALLPEKPDTLIKDSEAPKKIENLTEYKYASTLKEGLTSEAFLLSFLMCFLSSSGCYIVSNNIKNYGITQIPDDEYVTYISSIASFLNGATRILWGYFYDKFGFKKFYGITLIIQALTLIIYCPLATSRIFFAINNIIMMNLLGIQFCIFLPMWSHIFHPKIATTLVAYGFFSFSFACLIPYLLCNFLVNLISFVNLVWIHVVFAIISFCVLIYYKKPPDFRH